MTPPPDMHAKRMLDRAARHALRGFGYVEPNPMVGAVIVQGDRIIGEGHHRRFGGIHAEVDALQDCVRRGNDPRGATLFCTLEPCAHTGKQPPCTQAIQAAGIAKVVFARRDPNTVSSGGQEVLAAAGITCTQSNASALAYGTSEPFIKRITTGLPWVIAKWAQTIDGRVATRTGESKWISCEPARLRVHRLRGRVDAILTGIGTVLADDPMLTARGVAVRRTARRVIADTDLDLPPSSALAQSARSVTTLAACDATLLNAQINHARRMALIAKGVQLLGVPERPRAGGGSGIDLRALLKTLSQEHDVSTVLVEAGPGMLGSLIEDDLVDEAIIYIAPMLLGDELAKSVAVGRVAEQLRSARRYRLWRVKPVGGDVELSYRREAVG